MINKLQILKGKTKLKYPQSLSNYYDEIISRRQNGNFRIEEDPLSKSPQNIRKIYLDALLLMKLSKTKPQVKTLNIINMIYIIL